ncbi:MAG: hypothetical protein AAGM40_21470 [Cyanobacteria bacterium J06573_2]
MFKLASVALGIEIKVVYYFIHESQQLKLTVISQKVRFTIEMQN